jgi:DNA modification methylase
MRSDDGYILLAGGRRFTAAVVAGFETIPARIYNNLDELNRLEIELIENVERQDLTYAEDAELTRRIHELEEARHGKAAEVSGGASFRKTALSLGRSHTQVAQDYELAEAIDANPELANKKNKTEALKALRRAKEETIRAALARKLQEKKATTDLEFTQQKLIDSYLIGDCFTLLAQLPDNCMHIAEVDPPYGIDLTGKKAHAKEADYNEITKDYEGFIRRLCKELFRVLHKDAWLILWFGPDPWWAVVLKALRDAGFTCCGLPGYWYKPDYPWVTHQPLLRLSNAVEPFFYARKGAVTLQRPGYTNIFTYKKIPQDKKSHPTERPIELIQHILSCFATEGQKLLVPFAGSGNTLLAGANLELNVVGYDNDPSYKDSFVIKVKTFSPGEYTSYDV